MRTRQTKGFAGNTAFASALTWIKEQAAALEKNRGQGSIKSAERAIRNAKANQNVKECGQVNMHVLVTLDRGDFEKLVVMCGKKPIFEEKRIEPAAQPTNRTGGNEVLTPKKFSGPEAFEKAEAYAWNQAHDSTLTDRSALDSMNGFRAALKSALADVDVKRCGKKDWAVIVTHAAGDFRKLEVLCGQDVIFEKVRKTVGDRVGARARSGGNSNQPPVSTVNKDFTGANAFQNALGYVQQQAETMLEVRRSGSIRRAKAAIDSAQASPKVMQCGAVSRKVRVYVRLGDFLRLEVFCGRELVFEEDGIGRSASTRSARTTSTKSTKSTTKSSSSKSTTKTTKKKSTKPATAEPSAKIEEYIAGLTYDPQLLLSVVPDGTTSSLPVKDRQAVGNQVVICTKIQHTLKKNLSEVAILSPAAGVIFPGALVHADQDMMEGHPTPIMLPRSKVTLSIDLPGLSKPSAQVTADNSGVQKFLNSILEEWNQIPASQGYANAARSILQVSKAFSSQQVSLELGFNAEWASGSASAQVGVASTSEQSVVVAYFKQVFYTITMNTPETPASVFAKTLALKRVQQEFNNEHPPAYVRSIDYGRILMIKMESSKTDTSFEMKAAFQQATIGGNIDAKYREIIQNSTFTVLAVGGGAATPVQMFTGASDSSLQELQAYIAKDATYRRDNPGLPIAYTIVFLKDDSLARMGNSTDYTETECIRYNNGFVRLVHAGAYVAKFEVNWMEPDANGDYTIEHHWESGEKTSGYSEQIDLPGDAKAVRIKAWAMTGLVWDPWGEIMNIALDGPDNKTYRATGTTLGRSWDNG